MKQKITILAIAVITLFCGFNGDEGYFKITYADVKFMNPAGFPKPVYDLLKHKVTPDGFMLGRKLFYDPILSHDSSISCAFCHQRIAAFAHIDHKLSHGINGIIGKRNVPAIQNEIWSKEFMWDGGVNNLEMQPLAPLLNPGEMNENLTGLLKKLNRNKEYINLFRKAFNDTVINSQNLLKALAQFTGMMISCNSKYDKYMQGEEKFTEEESRGLELFRKNCSSCHKEPLFTDNTYRSIGLDINPRLSDSGRYKVTGDMENLAQFKVPSLRNAELTYPYMHDGRFNTLKEVLNNYNLKQAPDSHSDPLVRNGLSMDEKDQSDLIAFLKTLTDKTFIYDRRFADPNMK